MKTSPKVPAFSGRCHVQLLPGTAAQLADTARHLRDFRALAPTEAEAIAGVERHFGRMLAAMVLLLLLWACMSCATTHQEAHATHAEHATPSAKAWRESDALD